MSDFDRLLEEELEKQKKKKKQTVTPSKTLGNRLSYLPSYNRLTASDIAPVLRTTRVEDDDFAPIKTKDDDSKLDFFQKGAFSDGYQFGDISKTILGTVGDVGLNVVKGIAGLGEGVGDLVSYGIAGVADLAGKDEWADTVRSRAQESFVDKVTKDADDYLNRYSLLGRTSDSIMQGVGQVGGIIATGGIGAAAGLGSGGVTALTTGLMGLSGMGSGMGEAYKAGATDGEAVAYGAMAGAADATWELVFGGLGKAVNAVGFSKGLSSLDDIAAKGISKFISSPTGKNITEALVKSGFEGLEELGAGFTQAIAKKLTFMSEEEFGEIVKDENLLEQFLVGAFTSGVVQAPSVYIATKSGTDYVTGQTQNEQAVVKKEIENRIAEAEKDGKKLTAKEKSKIEAQVEKDMEKGYISTDTIEEVLGGETYMRYKQTVDSENALMDQQKALQEEFDTLNKMKQGEMTGEQIDRRTDLKEELAKLKETIQSTQNNSPKSLLKQQLGETVSEMVRSDRLIESYNERSRRGQAFEADLTRYDTKQRAVIEKAVNSGILNNTNRTHEFVDMVAKISADKGVLFDFTNNAKLKESGFAVDGKAVNGYFDTKSGSIGVNIDSAKALNSIVGHEITHVLEGTDLYTELQNLVVEYAKTKGDYQGRFDSLSKLYEGIEGADVNAELTADLVGDYLFTDADFINNLSTDHRNVFQKIYDEVKYLLKVVTAGSKEARELEKVKRAFENAYRESENASQSEEISDSNTKYSIREEAPPKNTGVAYKVFFVKDGKLYPPMVANPGGADTPMGVWLNADMGTAAPPSKTGRAQVKAGGKGTQGGGGSLAFRPGWHLGDLPRASQFDRVNPVTGKKELFPENFVWAEVEYAKDVDYQEEAMSYGYTDNGKFRHAYAGLPRLPENGYYRYRTNPKPDTVPWVITGAMKVNRLLSDAEVNAILEKNGVPPVHRQGGDVGLDKFGFNEDGTVKYSLANDGNGATFKGRPFWSGSVSLLDGVIEEVHTYKQAENADFHHSMYFSPGQVEKMANGENGFFWVDRGKVNGEWRDSVPKEIIDSIERQIVKYSLSDSKGRQLSDEQREYFKDSVVRDESGNLKVMYHGTSRGGFNVFDTYGSNYGLFGTGSYFTDSKTIGESYTKKGKGKNPQVYEAYLNIKNPIDMDAQADPAQWAKAFPDADFPKSGTNEDFYRAMEEFLEDEMLPKWEAAEIALFGIQDMGYDGITHIGGGRVNPNGERHQVYIAFEPEQIKNTDNLKPTTNPDIRYSLSTDSDGNNLTQEQEAYFKKSKMRDADGNLKVMYHGTQHGGFHTFDPDYSDDSTSLFFVDSNEVAMSYSGTSETYEAKTIRTAEDMNNFLAEIGYDQYEAVEKDGKFELLEDGDHVAASDTAQGIYKEFCWYEGIGDGDVNYKVYLNLENPYVVDAKDAEWHDLTFYEVLPEGLKSFYPNGLWRRGTTRDVAKYAKEQGFDGVIFNNIRDNGGFSNGSEGASTVAIAFNSNQIKSVANTKPTGDPDIRYSLSDSNGKKLSKEQSEYFKDSKAVDANGNLQLVYHGTRNADFTVFKRNVNYFTDSKEMADSYSPNGTMYEGYVNITNPYEIDAAGEKWSKIPIDAATKDFLQEYGASVFKEGGKWRTTPADLASAIEEAVDNGDMDYDGLIIRNIDDTGSYYKGKGKNVATDYIVFNSNQFKNADNLEPTADKDIRFSLSDESYLDAVNRGDMAAAQQMVNAAAKAKGYTDDSSWKMMHSAPNAKDDISLVALKESGLVPSDYWDHPEWYTYSPEERESFWKVKKAIETQEKRTAEGNPRDARMWVYRAVDKTKNVREDFFRNGDWVTPSHDYAVNEGKMNPNGYRIIKWNVPIKNLYWDGNSIAELGYDDGNSYAYADTKNNRKLLDPVTYDNLGNVIPLSKRFNKRDIDPRYSLSPEGAEHPTYGNYNVYGKDIALETAEEIAPVAENTTVSKTESVDEMFPDNLVPAEAELENLYAEQEDIIGAMEAMAAVGDYNSISQLTQEYEAVTAKIREIEQPETERVESLDDTAVPPEMDAPYPGEASAEPADPFAERDMVDVGNRKVKAYQYENPEVKPFFQEAAFGMLGDLSDTIPGEKLYNDEVYYESGGERGWSGTKRQTTSDIAWLKDTYGYTYDQIRDGVNAIVEDDGKENNAVSKRIEFLLHERLVNGYTGVFGDPIPPNQEYIDFLKNREINEYSREAFEALLANADRYAPAADDIAPVSTSVQTAAAEVAPVKEEYVAVTPKRKKEPKMVRADKPFDQKTANILVNEPKVEKKKNRLWSMVKENILDNGMVFEDLALKTNNRELQAKWNFIRYAQSMAQRMVGNGAENVKSLNAIREEVEKSGKTQEFYEYLYHWLNVDRMTLENRYEDTPNKAVFGDSVTADMSRVAAVQLGKANPEFRSWAQDVYRYSRHLRDLMVNNGVISQETADLWQDMYPHYVPIRRVDDTGLNINVPLDTGRTGVNAPIKRATGGNSDILPLFDTMAQRTLQTYKAIAKNSFGVELKNTLGTTIAKEQTDVDGMIDSVDQHEELLQEGKNGKKPTFTVFENGEKVTFEITDEMYNAMKPASDLMSYTNPVSNTVSNIHRGLLTEYNPVFMATNAIKDTQDILINSQHPVRTYANLPRATWQIAKNGKWFREYMEHGGEDNTYFDGENNSFDTEEKGVRKLLGIPPLSWISKANNFIERTPRLAEYIASREAGRSIEVSMLDAARVTTNFAAGGKLTKFANRNGATFLNASVQGVVQQARNIREAKANGLKGWAQLAGKFALAGLPALLLNNLMWDDDDEYEELSDYVKQNYYIVGKYGDGKFVRIPKGRTLAIIQNAFEQMENAITGDDEVDLKSFLELVVSNLAPNNPVEDNILAPIIQVAKNETWYGEDLVPTRLQDLPAAEQFDESTDAISKWLGEKLNFSPYKINYLLDQYSGGIGDTFLPMLTPEAESGDNSFLGNVLAPAKSKFTTDSVMNNQNVSDFYDLRDELTTNAKASTATDEDKLMSKYINSVNSEISELYAQKRQLQNSNLPADRKYEKVRDVQQQIVDLIKEGMSSYQNVSYEGEYARVGDRLYTQNEDGEWQKLSDEQVTKYEVTKAAGDALYATDGTNHYRWYEPGEDAGEDAEPGWRKVTEKELERQNEVTSGLGITPEEYWGNKDEYSYAYDYPENYAVAKAVGGYDAYKQYSSDLYDIKADKDEYGKSISGSRKEKVLDYINGLDADYYTKLILYKSEYTSYDDENYEIIEYLNSREDISFEEEIAILRKLGFDVTAEGDISW